jgi:hypothetical protein
VTELSMPNPGYPAPKNMRVYVAGGVAIHAKTRFVDVVLDAGVPTPRFALVLPDDLDISNYKVERIDGLIPPGTIVMFEQAGNAQENAERIVEQSRRAAFEKLMMSRKDVRGR